MIYAIAESRAKAGVIWVGTNDGLVQVTQDDGKTWTNVAPNIPGMPMWGSVRHVEPSKYDAATAYIICDAHQENNRDPWVYKTNDYGKTWKLIVTGIPKSMLSYAHIIREDPVRRGLLYLGTENALYASFDDGEHWQPLQMNLPHAPVYGMTIQEHFNDLVISTYGRGIYILDDLSPLQMMTPEIAASNAYLFAPRAAYRWDGYNGNVSGSDDQTAGQNPPTGAGINYWLKAAPQAAPTLTISDSSGKTVRTLTGTRQVGLNRVYWDLNNESTKSPRMRTKPVNDAEFVLDPDGTRDAPGFGTIAVRMPPGRYTVKLTVDGQTLHAATRSSQRSEFADSAAGYRRVNGVAASDAERSRRRRGHADHDRVGARTDRSAERPAPRQPVERRRARDGQRARGEVHGGGRQPHRPAPDGARPGRRSLAGQARRADLLRGRHRLGVGLRADEAAGRGANGADNAAQKHARVARAVDSERSGGVQRRLEATRAEDDRCDDAASGGD